MASRIVRHLFKSLLVTLGACAVLTPPAYADSHIPFVGCRVNVQGELHKAPQGPDIAVSLAADTAGKLAFYKADQGIGVIGPRGWNCFETDGSSGWALYLTPDKIDPSMFYSQDWKGFSGPAIELGLSDGDTSGRFEVAEIVARVFPKYRSFVAHVIAEGIRPSSDFPFGPYPKDRLRYRNDHMVEFQTPPATPGLGTASRLQANNNPILGAAIFKPTGEPYLLQLTMRLPKGMEQLAPDIIHAFERTNLPP